MPLKEETKQLQRQLADYCRTGELQPEISSNTVDGRTYVYRRLVYNGVFGALTRAYPITKGYLGEDLWDELVSEFFENHPSSSPLLWKMPRGLVDYCEESEKAVKFDMPYLDDLLLFEWTEVEVYMMQDLEADPYLDSEDLFSHPLVLNPEMLILNLEYPVFKAKKEELTSQKGAYYVGVYRHPEYRTVKFFELSPFNLSLLGLMMEGFSPEDATNKIANQASIAVTSELLLGIKSFISAAKQAKLVLGRKK